VVTGVSWKSTRRDRRFSSRAHVSIGVERHRPAVSRDDEILDVSQSLNHVGVTAPFRTHCIK
jgi:hypothetical protein